METLYAPAERDTIDEVRRSFSALDAELPYHFVLDLMPSVSFIVNSRRQILFANAAALEKLKIRAEDILGARSGEVLGCIHSREMPGGCGSSEACRVCGAVNAILEALDDDRRNSRECRIGVQGPEGPSSLDLLVTAVPIASEDGRFAVVTLDDIGDSKRREVLERMFFHDVMNSLTNLRACVELLAEEIGPAAREHDYLGRLVSTTENLIDEVQQQREIITMEKGEFCADPRETDLAELAREAVRHVEITAYAKSRIALACPEGASLIAFTDPVLLRRVVGNMLKNALEASKPEEEISLALRREEDGAIAIEVHNSSFIPRDVQLQIFQRSFSTKGTGRGLGTYSMKILTEEYLGGTISFSSDELGGTTFRLRLPLTEARDRAKID
ncbi:MAG TPA: ATP-binding protein [Rectinemataceae bacterium]|nr:ATP-binding protein [Rectinemataceae bacterium]